MWQRNLALIQEVLAPSETPWQSFRDSFKEDEQCRIAEPRNSFKRQQAVTELTLKSQISTCVFS